MDIKIINKIKGKGQPVVLITIYGNICDGIALIIYCDNFFGKEVLKNEN